MELKKDWSLAYLMHYICWLGYWGAGFYLVTMIATTILVSSDGYLRILDFPVVMEFEQFSDYEDLKSEAVVIGIPGHTPIDIDIKANTDQYWPQILLLYLVKSLSGVVMLIVLFFMSRVFKNVAEEDPFHPSNPTYLFYCGSIVLITGCINILLFFIPIPLLNSIDLPPGYVIQRMSLPTDILLLTGIIFIVLGYVFKEGARIHEELKLTV